MVIMAKPLRGSADEMAKKVRNCAIWGPRIHHHPMAASLVNGGGSFHCAATTSPAGCNSVPSSAAQWSPVWIL